MKPSWKDPEIEKFLEEQFGRTTAIESDHCIATPVGCGSSITNFEDYSPIELSEYKISGLCKACQLLAFGDGRNAKMEGE